MLVSKSAFHGHQILRNAVMILIIAQSKHTVPALLVFMNASVLMDILVICLIAQVGKHF